MCSHGTGTRLGQCVSEDYCEYDADCSGMTACVANACVPAQCTQGKQAICAPYVCQSHACLSSCSAASECDSQHTCQDEKCVLR
ncbi:MAG TPA: hypothetical protein VJV79_06485 [Polyangiaceae bacterium]|nr:hypothetical protein [Polyangiaceae bacterium]